MDREVFHAFFQFPAIAQMIQKKRPSLRQDQGTDIEERPRNGPDIGAYEVN